MPSTLCLLLYYLLLLSAARDAKYDVVLIDTAGRMQDNEPLMRALSKVRCKYRLQTWLFPMY